jgi:plasmid maintenance system antidote protein VapI
VTISDANMNEISPQQVFAILSDDVDRCFEIMNPTADSPEEVEEHDYEETAVRSYVRAAFACMEGMAFCMRAWAAERVPESQAEQQADLESNLTAMFTQLDQVMRIEPQLGTGRQWWLNLQKALELRHRMAHPRSWTDLALTREEILTVVDADAGFRLLLSRYLEV